MTMRVLAICLLLPIVSPVTAQEFQLHSFARQQLSDVYYAEGIAAGDLNADGTMDIVYGPHWYAGPEFTVKQEIYAAVPQNREGYADNFFNWVYDFDEDGANDILVVGFPGTAAYVYQNPGNDGLTRLWEKHQVADSVGNEAPQFADITGDGVPELVCTRKGNYGFYVPQAADPLAEWQFFSISEPTAPHPFGHGLGSNNICCSAQQKQTAPTEFCSPNFTRSNLPT